VFEGASRILAVVRPELIYFEVSPGSTLAAGFGVSRAARLLADTGYELKRFGRDGHPVRTAPEAASEVMGYENWIAMPVL
jgi:hypothetical protein